MDEYTISMYSTAASLFAAEWREQQPPTDTYALFLRYFLAGGGMSAAARVATSRG
jgi:hypothetical protein